MLVTEVNQTYNLFLLGFFLSLPSNNTTSLIVVNKKAVWDAGMKGVAFSKVWFFTGTSGASYLLQSAAASVRDTGALQWLWHLGAVQGLSPMDEDCREQVKGLAVFVEFLLVYRIWGFKSYTVGIQLGLRWVVLLPRGWWRCPCIHFPVILNLFPGIRGFSDAIGSARLVGIGLNRLWKTSQSTSIIP